MSKRLEKQYAGQGMIKDGARGVTFDFGPTVPSDATPGYAPGAIFIDDDSTASSQYSCLASAITLPP